MPTDAWLTILQAGPAGSSGILKLFRSQTSAKQIVKLSAGELRAAGIGSDSIQRLHSPDEEQLSAWRNWLDLPGHTLLTLAEPAYPALLQALPDPPLALWVVGDQPERLNAAQLAMVGSRNPTQGGADTAERFARYLSDHGLMITSGLAAGIDGACHRGGLAGAAGTIAVLGSGVDVIYPKSHTNLANSLLENGLIVSEYPPQTAPRALHFPQRNRIIAGLSVGTLVVEAARRSGSLITARLAAEYGREVFAMPGSIHSPLARGCHRLIKDGAKLVEDANDVLVELSALLQVASNDATTSKHHEIDPSALTKRPGYLKLLQAMAFAPCSVGVLGKRTGLTTAELSSMLLQLELEGFVEALPGGLYSRLPKRTA
jgi:DNA processing protein